MRESDEYYLQADIKSPVTISKLKKYNEVFISVSLGLIERGIDHVCAWVEANRKDFNFATFFGFENTGFLRAINRENESVILQEMIYVFPQLDDNENT